MAPILMYDGINSDAAIIHQNFPDSPVAYYGNGAYAWSASQVHMFSRHIAISVTAHVAEESAYPRVLDVERGDATPEDVRGYLEKHRALGFTNGTVYCDASTVGQVLRAVGNLDVPRWWIAWYWGRPGVPSVQQVQTAVALYSKVQLPVSKIWACQFVSKQNWDISQVYGVQDFAS